MKCLSRPLLVVLLTVPIAVAKPSTMVNVPGGSFRVLFPANPASAVVHVPTFQLDRYPVTNAEMLAFILANPKWQRDRVPAILAEPNYLAHWETSTRLGSDINPLQPVTRVSWFAARAYCQARGAHLPSEDQWEFAAAASDTRVDARHDTGWQQQILGWYATAGQAKLSTVGSHPPNVYGIYDLHGLIWEWIEDFGSNLVTTDARAGSGTDPSQFCGGSTITSGDKGEYVAFMRYAFRSSLNAAWTTSNLGFRCAIN